MERIHCNYRSIQKCLLFACYLSYLLWSYFKLQFKNEPGFVDTANKIDIFLSICIGILLRMSYGLGTTLREIADALPPEMSQRFESLFQLNQDTQTQVNRLATEIQNSFRVPNHEPFHEIPHLGETESLNTGRETVHMIDLNDGRKVEIRIPRLELE